MKKALITGVRGQDGAYLSQLLLAKGYQVYGVDSSWAAVWRLRELAIEGDIKDASLDLASQPSIEAALDRIQPDEIYNLAAQSFVQASFENPVATAELNALSVARLLEAVRLKCPEARFFQASTAELFGTIGVAKRAEDTDFHPKSPYAAAKLYAHWLTVNYREAFGLYTCCGILFNHESPLRGEQFLTRKIAMGVARIKKGLQEKVTVGNMDGRRDWGYAKEYVEAIWRMLQRPAAADYLLATGETHTVREFISATFAAADLHLKWEGVGLAERGIDAMGKVRVEVSKEFFRLAEVESLSGDASKAWAELGWQPGVKLQELAALMLAADLERLEKKT